MVRSFITSAHCDWHRPRSPFMHISQVTWTRRFLLSQPSPIFKVRPVPDSATCCGTTLWCYLTSTPGLGRYVYKGTVCAMLYLRVRDTDAVRAAAAERSMSVQAPTTGQPAGLQGQIPSVTGTNPANCPANGYNRGYNRFCPHPSIGENGENRHNPKNPAIKSTRNPILNQFKQNSTNQIKL